MVSKLNWIALLCLTGVSTYVLYPPLPSRIRFPNGKRFAFSIIDDTDMATLERLEPLYGLLDRYGLRTTKTVWALESNASSYGPNRGDSLQTPAYRKFIVNLQDKGFEIALHGVRGGSSRREEVLNGLDEFKRALGHYPKMQVNHSLNRENLYWGPHVLSFTPYRWAGGPAMRNDFHGHEPQSEYFWGDVAKRHIRYVGRFTFPGINLLGVNPSLPYRLPDKPFVNYWFSTANGDHINEFVELLKPENLDKLDREGGVCLVYSHLGSGSFNKNGRIDPRFEERIKDVASRNGWLAPASEILDYLTQQPGWTGDLGFRERVRLETLFGSRQVLERIF